MLNLPRLLFPAVLGALGILLAAAQPARAEHDNRPIAETADRLAYASEQLHDAVNDYGHDDELEDAADRLDDAASELRKDAEEGENPDRLLGEFDEVQQRFYRLSEYFAYADRDRRSGYFRHHFETIRHAYRDLEFQIARLDAAGPVRDYRDRREYRRQYDRRRHR